MATTTYGTPYVQSSDLVSAYPGTSSTLATRLDDVSLKGNGLNDQTGTSYTLVLTDGGKTVTLSNAAAVTVTIPTNTSVAFPTGAIVKFVNKGPGTVTIQPTGGVTLNGGNLTLAQYAAVQIVKLATDTWGQLDSVATTPGLVLISPTSIANSGGSASASGGSVTFTTVNSISLNGVFSATYENYRVALSISAQSANNDIQMRMRASGSDTTTATYNMAYQRGGRSTLSDGGSLTGTTFWILASAFTGYASQMSMDMYRANTSGAVGWIGQSFSNDAGFVDGTRGGNCTQATAHDGFTIISSTGTLTGTVRVYGYKN